MNHLEPEKSTATESDFECATLDQEGIWLRCGIGALLEQDRVSIVLPAIQSTAHCRALIESLQDIYERTPNDTDWCINFDNVSHLPMLLLGCLLSYAEQMRLRRQNMHLSAVSSDLLPAPYFEKLKDHFIIEN